MKDDIIRDSRIEKILQLIIEFASGNLDAKEKQSDKNDELDGIIGGLNMLGEELLASTVSRNFLENILNTMINGLIIVDVDLTILLVNPAVESLIGYAAGELVGKSIKKIYSDDITFLKLLSEELPVKRYFSGLETTCLSSENVKIPVSVSISTIHNHEDQIKNFIFINQDIRERKQREIEIHNLAFYDALTNIPNRRLLLDRFKSALSLSERTKHYGAVLFIDMDNFKNLNDMMGHEYGDKLLIEVAKRIQTCLRATDTVARLGGDEFIVLIEEVSGIQEQALQKVASIAEKIRKTLTNTYHLENYEYYSSPSIGICLYYGREKSVENLLKSADMAMYQAKEAGRNTIRFFDPIMQQMTENHAALELNLRNAVENHQLQLYYQIQVDNDFLPTGAEALIRWDDPNQGFISPLQFIPVAEESNLILDIGDWVIRSACRQLALWSQNKNMHHLTLSVNISARQFELSGFVENITSIIVAHKINPSLLKLELTEHVLLNDVTNVVAKMHTLKALGVQLSIDDFGTGYSSLSYLKQLPINQLKIDQSFIQDVATNPDDSMMVKTIINLAQNFHLDIIAEGVESEAQLNFLQQNGCSAYQGFLFSKPIPIEEFEYLYLIL